MKQIFCPIFGEKFLPELSNSSNDIIKKDIFLKEINSYDEILLLGSGKGVTSVKTINEIKWKRKNLDKFRFLSKHYNSAINKCNSHRF